FIGAPRGLNFRHAGAPSPPPVLAPPASPAYAWVWVRGAYRYPIRAYTFRGIQRGFSESRVIRNDPDSLLHLTARYRVDPAVDSIMVLHYLTNGPDGVVGTDGSRLIIGNAVYSSSDPPLGRPFIQDSYPMPEPDGSAAGLFINSQTMAYQHRRPFAATSANRLLETPFHVLRTGEPLRGYLSDVGPGIEVFALEGDHLNVGFAPPTWFGRF